MENTPTLLDSPICGLIKEASPSLFKNAGVILKTIVYAYEQGFCDILKIDFAARTTNNLLPSAANPQNDYFSYDLGYRKESIGANFIEINNNVGMGVDNSKNLALATDVRQIQEDTRQQRCYPDSRSSDILLSPDAAFMSYSFNALDTEKPEILSQIQAPSDILVHAYTQEGDTITDSMTFKGDAGVATLLSMATLQLFLSNEDNWHPEVALVAAVNKLKPWEFA